MFDKKNEKRYNFSIIVKERKGINMKSEKLRNIVSNLLTIVLIIYISIVIIFYSLLNISKNYINKDKMQNIINNIDISSIIKENIEMENIKNELIETGLSNETVETFLNSNEVKQFEEEVVTNIVYDILNKGNIEYKLSSEEINKLIYNNITELRTNGSYNKIAKKVELKLPSLVDNANNMLDKIAIKLQNSNTFAKYKGYINKLFRIFDLIYSKLVNIIIICIIISFIILLMIIKKDVFKSFKWIGLSFVIPSIVLTIFGFLLNQLFIDTKFKNIMNLIMNDFKRCSCICLLIGIAFIIGNLIIYIIINRKRKLRLQSN